MARVEETAAYLDGPGGSTTLYFDRFRCKTGESTGIYHIPNADTAS